MADRLSSIDPRRHRRQRQIAVVVVLAAIVAAAAALIFSDRDAQELAHENAYVPKQTKMTPELDLLRHYVGIDTSNPPGNELPAAQWLAQILESNGVHAEIIESAPRRASVYARVKGKRPDEGLLLLHHIDVVPANPAEWSQPPFAANIVLNQIYGRGTLDMKGIGICELRAFLDVAKAGRQPERDLVFLAVADEESGSSLGMKWLTEHRPDVLAGIRYALNEGGITEMQMERVTYFGIEIGTKQTVTLLLRGASRAQLQDVRIALEPWFYQRSPERITAEVRSWMRDLAPQRIDFRVQLADVDRTIAAGDFWRLPPGYREMTQDTVWAEAVVPRDGAWEMRTHLLNLPDTNPDERIAWLRNKVTPFAVRIGEIVRKEGPAPLTSDRTPMFALLADEAKRAYGAPVGTEILNRWFNDSRFLRKRGIAAYGIDPFPVDYFQSETIHQPNERIRVDYFQQGVEYLRRVVSRFAFAK
jgi:acetylornithine deacetylase/succinyl-diaminopimelate desuccinylase-like protein